MEKWIIEFSEKSEFVHNLKVREKDKYELMKILTRLYSGETTNNEIRKVIESNSLENNDKVKEIERIFYDCDNPFWL